MGTVHGVYLKYVGISAISCAGFAYFMTNDDGSRLTSAQLVSDSTRALLGAATSNSTSAASLGTISLGRAIPALVLGYSTVVNGLIALLFKLEAGMSLLGKDSATGDIPIWSHVLFFPFHIPTLLYTHVHTLTGTHKVEKEGKIVKEICPVATEVQPGWWVGGCYAHQLKKDWGAVIDLTVEFPESCIKQTREYLSMPTWDGVPATPAQLDEAATFAVKAKDKGGDILVHCAHGRGRSTTVMCACLVKAGLYANWSEAFEKGIKPQRTVCKLNRRMQQNLQAWQEEYVDKKGKGQ
jgi:protein-tyrosine phosphatase